MCGATTCLWQAFPELTGEEIRQAIKESADRYTSPNNQYGYGIPDFESVYVSLKVNENNVDNISIYPNPNISRQTLSIIRPISSNTMIIKIIDVTGKLIYNTTTKKSRVYLQLPILDTGMYLLQFSTSNTITSKKLIIE